MNTGILLITHDKVAPALVDTASMILQRTDLGVKIVEAPADCDTQAKQTEAEACIQELDQGQGVLLLNDVYGATPFNIAQNLTRDGVALLSGLNLSMLMRALTYQHLPVHELAEKAREGGVNGVRYPE